MQIHLSLLSNLKSIYLINFRNRSKIADMVMHAEKDGLELLVKREHPDPHSILGIHEVDDHKVIRLFRPGYKNVHVELGHEMIDLTEVKDSGLFECKVPMEAQSQGYKICHPSGMKSFDPYSYLPTFTDQDAELFNRGVHYETYHALGGRLTDEGVKFAVWAPCAMQVALVGAFNEWDGNVNPMRKIGASGVWELFIPGLKEGERYKFEVKTDEGHILLKGDPYAYYNEVRPGTASKISDVESYIWDDSEWMAKRQAKVHDKLPMNIYELHMGSWVKDGEEFINYRTLASKLVDYCKEMSYNYVEFLPLSEHPYDESWGYQVSGYYAITSRFGSVEDFQYMVDYLHQYDIGVILDWVPAHFPMDAFALAQWDGTHIYEHEDPRQGFHPSWNTHIFNYGRYEVSNFLIGSALFYFEKMHIDGIRMDAVASVLYLDFERKDEEWIPNKDGGNENLEAIEFVKHLNAIVHEKFPGALMIAEDSSSYPGVTKPVKDGGLGFDLKWGIGWMSDTLKVFECDFQYRYFEMKHIANEMEYFYSEKFVLTLSHDEVVHGLKSLLSKMPGDEWQKFAGLRLLLSYQMCHPGKKLLFMGGEIGQWTEWFCKEEVHWHLLQQPYHAGLKKCVAEMNKLYLMRDAFWENDFEKVGFEWIEQAVLSYWRKGETSQMICIHHFSAEPLKDYLIPVKGIAEVKEVFNSDAKAFGGLGLINSKIKIENGGVRLTVPPLTTIVLEAKFG